MSKNTIKRKTTPPEIRFWKHVNKNTKSGCWEWTGSKDKKGYGSFCIKTRKTMLAHRFSYKLHFGNFSQHLFVCHHCDNPACINPKHLFLGTRYDNILDMMLKGRQNKGPNPKLSGKNHWSYKYPEKCLKGEKNKSAKLTEKQVIEIRNKYIPYKISCYKLANEYNVNPSLIHKIIHYVLWKHI